MSEGLKALKELEQELTGFDGYIILHDKLLITTIRNELNQYKEIEEELGIDLVTLIKALKNGCYIKPWKEIKYSYEIRTGSDNIHLFLLDENDNDYLLKDYGKTWALTKEELK